MWYNLYMNREAVSETSNAEMVTIPRADYDAVQTDDVQLVDLLRG